MSKVLRLNNINLKSKTSKRVGRGSGSKGGRCGRGSNGQKAKEKVNLEGGQFPTYLRFKKRGFFSKVSKNIKAISTKSLCDFARKNTGMNLVKIENIKSFFKIKPKYLIKIIGSNLKEEDEKLLKGVKFETNLASKNLCKESYVLLVNEKEHTA